MDRPCRCTTAVLFLWILLPGLAAAEALRVDHDQVRRWNAFADALLLLHTRQLAGHPVVRHEELGGYADRPDFYNEVSYHDDVSGRLLSRIRWERGDQRRVHSIEVFEYDAAGTLQRDYLATYLPVHRNAPIQTLVNLHHRADGLQAYRQFDASGVRIYEQCKGQYQGEQVMVSLDEDELPLHTGRVPADVGDALYAACFDAVPTSADSDLARLFDQLTSDSQGEGDAIAHQIDLLSGLIDIGPPEAQWYLDRGHGYFQLHEFEQAIADLDRAIALDATLDQAWFWRGMARGRAGLVEDGIADLSVYIQRHPDDSLAHTKRGVRYIWLGDFKRAQQDLERAVALDATNAEAHDDLGVIYAQQQRHDAAERHFLLAIRHDPDYQKAYHNLAMIKHLTGDQAAALQRVEQALRLAPESRTGLLLKAAILQAMGRMDEAVALNEQAEFLPEGNWSERLSP